MSKGLGTKCVQGGYTPKNGEPRQIPIVQSTTFKYATSEAMGQLFDLEAAGYFYTRLQNPTNDSVAAKIAELEAEEKRAKEAEDAKRREETAKKKAEETEKKGPAPTSINDIYKEEKTKEEVKDPSKSTVDLNLDDEGEDDDFFDDFFDN